MTALRTNELYADNYVNDAPTRTQPIQMQLGTEILDRDIECTFWMLIFVLHCFKDFFPACLTKLCLFWYGLKYLPRPLYTTKTLKLSMTVKTDDITSSTRDVIPRKWLVAVQD